MYIVVPNIVFNVSSLIIIMLYGLGSGSEGNPIRLFIMIAIIDKIIIVIACSLDKKSK